MKYFPALLALGLLAIIPLQAHESDSEMSPDPVVITKLEEIVKLREHIAETAKLELELGKGDALNEAFVDLSEAKLALATEKGDHAAIISELEAIVEFRKMVLKREQLLAEENRRTQKNLGELTIKVLEAEIRLQRAYAKHAAK